MRLDGKVAIVTGAAQGIGRAYAERFAAEGAAVVLVDTQADTVASTAEGIRVAGGTAVATTADVTDADAMNTVVADAVSRFGRIDALINNAALYGTLDFRDQSVEYLEHVMRVNVFGALVAARAVFPRMKAQRGGSIINISSTAAYEYVTQERLARDQATIPSFSYSLTKAALVSLTKFMAGTIGKYGIRVNCIAPGMVTSETTLRIVPKNEIELHGRMSAMQQTLTPADLAGTAVFLASDDSRLLTGQIVCVDAGYVMAG